MSHLAAEMRELEQNGTVNAAAGHSDIHTTSRYSRNERSNKGRRRRAAAEQRRIDQQRWGQYITEGEEDSVPVMPVTAPRSSNRRRARRNQRNGSAHEEYYEDELTFLATGPRDEVCEDFDLEMALSLSLSLADPNPNSGNHDHINRSIVNMSYESLVQLESVKCVAPVNVVSSMLGIIFDGNKSEQGSEKEEEKCAICQCEYECGEHVISLPCTHAFHYTCGTEWLLNYSKLCPICKLDVTEQKIMDM